MERKHKEIIKIIKKILWNYGVRTQRRKKCVLLQLDRVHSC